MQLAAVVHRPEFDARKAVAAADGDGRFFAVFTADDVSLAPRLLQSMPAGMEPVALTSVVKDLLPRIMEAMPPNGYVSVSLAVGEDSLQAILSYDLRRGVVMDGNVSVEDDARVLRVNFAPVQATEAERLLRQERELAARLAAESTIERLRGWQLRFSRAIASAQADAMGSMEAQIALRGVMAQGRLFAAALSAVQGMAQGMKSKSANIASGVSAMQTSLAGLLLNPNVSAQTRSVMRLLLGELMAITGNAPAFRSAPSARRGIAMAFAHLGGKIGLPSLAVSARMPLARVVLTTAAAGLRFRPPSRNRIGTLFRLAAPHGGRITSALVQTAAIALGALFPQAGLRSPQSSLSGLRSPQLSLSGLRSPQSLTPSLSRSALGTQSHPASGMVIALASSETAELPAANDAVYGQNSAATVAAHATEPAATETNTAMAMAESPPPDAASVATQSAQPSETPLPESSVNLPSDFQAGVVAEDKPESAPPIVLVTEPAAAFPTAAEAKTVMAESLPPAASSVVPQSANADAKPAPPEIQPPVVLSVEPPAPPPQETLVAVFTAPQADVPPAFTEFFAPPPVVKSRKTAMKLPRQIKSGSAEMGRQPDKRSDTPPPIAHAKEIVSKDSGVDDKIPSSKRSPLSLAETTSPQLLQFVATPAVKERVVQIDFNGQKIKMEVQQLGTESGDGKMGTDNANPSGFTVVSSGNVQMLSMDDLIKQATTPITHCPKGHDVCHCLKLAL